MECREEMRRDEMRRKRRRVPFLGRAFTLIAANN
jgi:hypothetical protein